MQHVPYAPIGQSPLFSNVPWPDAYTRVDLLERHDVDILSRLTTSVMIMICLGQAGKEEFEATLQCKT